MTKVVTVLGRQPALGLAELESLFGADKLKPIGKNAALLDIEPANFPLHRLGGTIKAAELITELPFTDWQKITSYLVNELPKFVSDIEPGKVTIGISVYGLRTSPGSINATALSIKKAIRAENERPVRVVPNKELELSSAQVLHNNLAKQPFGVELLLIRESDKTIVAHTFAVQDINAYAARDQARPKRDARVGMLPPKLAQIIVNLATAEINFLKNRTIDAHEETYEQPFDVSDPFCGTGVLLQEALLMGYSVYGSDNDPRMMGFTSTNLRWLVEKNHLKDPIYNIYIGDATENGLGGARTIACETYLGRAFSVPPRPEVLQAVMQDVDTIHRKFLKNVAKQTKPGFRMCIAVPAWKTHSGFKHLKTLDSLEELGYTRVSFAHVRNEELTYHREGQIVGRELVVLTRK